jgi:hypothetical protein
LYAWRAAALVCFAIAILLAGYNVRLRQATARISVPVGQVSETAVSASKPTSLPAWGRLEIERIVLERPDTLLRNVEGYYQAYPWMFSNISKEELRKLFAGAGLSVEQHQWLGNPENWHQVGAGYAIQPPHELLLELPTMARAHIYTHLAYHPGNPFINDPFFLPATHTNLWFEQTSLSPATIQLVQKLLYRRHDHVLFSDLAAVGRQIPEPERLPLLKLLSRTPAVRAFVRIETHDDLSSLVAYWGNGGNAQALRSLLESLERKPDNGRLDVAYLLPAFARDRLFTYPDPDADRNALVTDCFWTALNFHRRTPENRFLDPAYRLDHLAAEYDVVEGPRALGDLLVFYDRAGTAIHACIQVADDVVFTKNGSAPFAPWVLMKSADMLAYYTTDHAPRMVVYRARRPIS